METELRVYSRSMLRPRSANDKIHVVQEKTGAELSLPIHPCLWESIKAYPAKGVMLIGNASTGRPIKGSALTLLVHRAAKQAGLTKRCKVHGLRKAASRRLAEHGATAKEIAATTGQKTLREIERYTEAADQERLSTTAIGKLPRKRTKNESV